MPMFHVAVKCDTYVLDGKPFDFEQDINSQNAVHAAATGLTLVGCGYAASIEVTALKPVGGRPALTTFRECGQSAYGFFFGSRVFSATFNKEVMV